ncbi:MAG: hypothetical protein QXX55_01670 [Candidatus Pacearchaeota archaeon]
MFNKKIFNIIAPYLVSGLLVYGNDQHSSLKAQNLNQNLTYSVSDTSNKTNYNAKNNDSTKIEKSYNIFADSLKSKEVLVKWDKKNDRAYVGTGIPVMSIDDTLSLPENVKGDYKIILYKKPKGVKLENKKIITSKEVEEGIINGALIYLDPQTNKIKESVRLIVPIFRGKIDSEKISKLEEKVKDLIKERDKYEEEINNYQKRISILEENKKKKQKVIEKREKSTAGFGLESYLGTNSEFILGLFFEKPISKWINIEGYLDGFLSYFTRKDNGRPISTETIPGENTKIRQFRLDGSVKYRTDVITNNLTDKAIGSGGIRIILKPYQNFEIPLGFGVVATKREKRVDGEAIITIEYNGEPVVPTQIIKNSKSEDPTLSSALSLSGGIRFKLNNNLSLETSLSKIKKLNSVRGGIRWKF